MLSKKVCWKIKLIKYNEILGDKWKNVKKSNYIKRKYKKFKNFSLKKCKIIVKENKLIE